MASMKCILCIITTILIIFFTSCGSWNSTYFHEINFTINDKKYVEKEFEYIVYNNAHYNDLKNIWKDETDDESLNDIFLLKIDDDNKLFLVFSKVLENSDELILERIIVNGSVDDYFDQRFNYNNINVKANVEHYRSSTALGDANVYYIYEEFNFSGSFQIDTTNDTVIANLSNGYAKFGFYKHNSL